MINNMEVDLSHENSTLNSKSLSDERSNLRVCLLSHLLECENVCVKSQQIGEPELNRNERQKILEQILDQNHGTFLSRFGHYLHPVHLSYFNSPSDDESYEVQFYLNKLRKKKQKLSSDVQVKNRRFEAMKRLMSEGEYFSVSEMRKRNPLLFDQLLGNFLKNPKTDINQDQKYQVAHILLDQFEQDQIASLKKSQLEAEMREIDECCSSDDEQTNEFKETSSKLLITSADDEINQVLWGSTYKGDDVIGKKRWKDKHGVTKPLSSEKQNLSQEEKLLLINEFTSSMFNNFLEGKDEFDYSEVDNNPEYDDMKQCEIDEQEKYFDSESPQDAIDCNNSEEDELDRFMKEVDHQIETENLADKIKGMNSQESGGLKD